MVVLIADSECAVGWRAPRAHRSSVPRTASHGSSLSLARRDHRTPRRHGGPMSRESWYVEKSGSQEGIWWLPNGTATDYLIPRQLRRHSHATCMESLRRRGQPDSAEHKSAPRVTPSWWLRGFAYVIDSSVHFGRGANTTPSLVWSNW
jgi:hypothetical protein